MELRINDKWRDYADATIDSILQMDPTAPKPTQKQRDDIRQAFYAGACCVFHIMNTDMMDETKTERERETVLDDLAREIKMHMEELHAQLRKIVQ
jgi:hypothetical protein